MSKTITVSAKQYEDHDDCLQAAADDYMGDHPEAEGYDLNARWVDDEREEIALDVPRTDDQWWAWHDKDSSRWSATDSEAEASCAAWVAGESDYGPES